MNALRLFALSASTTLLLAACGAGEDPLPLIPKGHNDLLSHVDPASPYVMANLETIPENVLDSYLEKMKPVAEELQRTLAQAKTDLQNESQGTDSRLALAILEELDGNLSREGLSSLGIDLNVRHVFYGEGAFPVFRLELKQPEALRATVQRVMENSGVTFAELDHQGTGYWRISDLDGEEIPLGLYVSILPNQLAIGLHPLAEEDHWLPRFLGQDMPAGNAVEATLQGINQEFRYQPYGTGYVDTRKFADQLLDPDSSLVRLMSETEGYKAEDITEACRSEIYAMADKAPRIVMGVDELTASAASTEMRVQIEPTLATQLMGLSSNIPLASSATDYFAEVSLGLKTGALRDFLLEKSQAIVDQPFKCEHLADLNQQASQLQTQLSQPMPPFINNFRGIRARLKDIDMNQLTSGQEDLVRNSDGLLALHVEKPEMLVGMGQMFLPGLAEVTLVAGEPPVQLPASVIPVSGVISFAAMTNHAIGVSIGEGEEAGLPAFLDAPPGPDGIILSASYDADRFADWTGNMQQNHANSDESHRLQEAWGDAWNSMLDRSYVEVKFAQDGLVVKNRATIK